jgi:hypothetical protein
MKRPAAASLLTAIALVAIPIAAYGAAEPAAKSSDYYTKKVCDTIKTTGSRLGGTRRCRTRAEIDAARQESRQVLERVQAFKPVVCMPPDPC